MNTFMYSYSGVQVNPRSITEWGKANYVITYSTLGRSHPDHQGSGPTGGLSWERPAWYTPSAILQGASHCMTQLGECSSGTCHRPECQERVSPLSRATAGVSCSQMASQKHLALVLFKPTSVLTSKAPDFVLLCGRRECL